MKEENYLTAGYSVRSWFFSTDHKRVAVLYLFAVTAFFFLGLLAALVMRLELLTPTGRLVDPETYNKLFTMHGVIMVFLFLFPSLLGVIGNFVVPIMLGAKNCACPRLNLTGWYFYMIGGLLALAAITLGGTDTGWTFMIPFSSFYSYTHVSLMAFGIFMASLSPFCMGINFVATIHRRRAPGMHWPRMPIFLRTLYVTGWIFILTTPVLGAAMVMLLAERWFPIGYLGPAAGGHPFLFQNLFWFYAHAAVYVIILPAIGVVSEIIPCFSRRRLFGYRFIAGASLLFAALALLGWGEHLVVSGTSIYAGLIFSLLSLLLAVPTAVIITEWIATLFKGRIYLRTPMLYALGSIGLWVVGSLSGLLLATPGMNIHLHNTHFVLAHFHYIIVGGVVMAYLGAIHFWWPKISGHLYKEFWGKLSALIIFIGVNLTFFPQFISGYLGLLRRSSQYPPEFQVLNVLSTAGASILVAGYALPLVYLIWSTTYGPKAGSNPWNARGLEWQTASPPPKDNFPEIPVVTEETYAYASDQASKPPL